MKSGAKMGEKSERSTSREVVIYCLTRETVSFAVLFRMVYLLEVIRFRQQSLQFLDRYETCYWRSGECSCGEMRLTPREWFIIVAGKISSKEGSEMRGLKRKYEHNTFLHGFRSNAWSLNLVSVAVSKVLSFLLANRND